MKKLHFIALSLVGSISFAPMANEFPICRSDLTKQMKRFEKTDFTVPRKIPSGDLKEYALQMEILCPWQIEIDLNGDKQLDWAGIIHRNNQFDLVAYLSGTRKYELQLLHTYAFFPEQTYLKVTRKKTKKQKNRIGKKFIYDIAEITLNETSRIYSLDKNQFKVISQYEDITILNSHSKDNSDMNEDID